MKENKFFLNTALAVILFVILLVAAFIRAFAPGIIIPELDVPALVLISLVALLADHYVTGGAKRCYICIPLLSALTFGLLPFAACFTGLWEALKLGLIGGAVFTAVTWIYSSMQDRISTAPAVSKLAPLLSAFGLFLASQIFAGWIL